MAEKAAILNLIKSNFFKMHPHLKSHILFNSNGLAIQHGLPNIARVKSEFYRVKFFQDASSSEITHFVL